MNPSDEHDFTEFVRAHGDRLLRFARLLVPDAAEAEDALQTALLRLTRHWSRGLDSPEAYVRAALVNLAKDRGRRRHLVPLPVELDPGLGPAGPDHAEAVAARAQLDQVLAALPPRQRVAVVLRVVEGLSEAETAALMRCAAGTAKSNLARGLARAREILQQSTPAQHAPRPQLRTDPRHPTDPPPTDPRHRTVPQRPTDPLRAARPEKEATR